LRFGEVKVETTDGQHAFEVQVYLGEVDPNEIRVELYANGAPGTDPIRQEMKPVRYLVGAVGGHVYSGLVPANRPLTDYTARMLPHHDGVAVPLEVARILWQR